eukprot:TRINITY_DN69502_c0_g1_i1.p1 TRINITY_DN69502_c0_g1~~TRINITY_DN69502_c0_g1_i1.p1  ORF type:complete len:196 (+),score=28.26 TRINITY_DN69502_c0_g1_i1:74-589(+)
MAGVCRLSRMFAQYSQQTRAQNSFSLAVSKRLQFIGSSDDLMKSTFEFPLHQSDCHAFTLPKEGQTVHAGVISLVIQDVTTMHLCASDFRGRKAVTTDMNLSFMGVGKVGRTLRIDTEVLKAGAHLGVAEARVNDMVSNRLLAVARHTMMFVGDDNSSTQFSESLNSVFDV